MQICFNMNLNTLIPLILIVCIKIQSVNCKNACQLIKPNAKEGELLEKLKPLYGQILETKDQVNPANYSYKIGFCNQIHERSEEIGAVQYTSNNETHVLGRYNKVEIINGSNWILLTYYGGDKYPHTCNGTERETKIMIICDPKVLVGKLQILEERITSSLNCYYLFELGSNVSCSASKETSPPNVHEQEGYSSGSIFCILFFTFASAYLFIGFLYKRLVVGAKGLEQIPNYSFWKDFGNLQADGCDYICRCGPRQESQAYRGIDDHLKMEDERDDQLLNM